MTIEGLHQNAENLVQTISKFASLLKQKRAILSIISSTKSRKERKSNEQELKQIDSQLLKIKPYILNINKNIELLCNEELNKNV